MSAIPVDLTVSFKAKTIGAHRVAYRTGSGSYSYVSTTCAILGACSAVIPIFVDNDSCDVVQYNGYIQAECEDIDSTTGRLTWAVDFMPAPSCKSYAVTCYQLDIASVTITERGSSYETPPTVTFIGGGGVATGTAVVGSGGLLTAVISIAGSGYVNNTYTNVDLTGGAGTGAKATVIIAGGSVTSVVITTPGTGYVDGDALVPDPADVGGAPGVAASITVTTDLAKVISVTGIVTTTQFTSLPAVSFSGGGGTAAAGTVVLDECPEIDSPGCIGAGVTIPADTLELGDTVNVCDQNAPVQAGEYTVTENGDCLCACVQATIGITGTVGQQVRASWTKCGLEARSLVLTKGGSPQSVIDCIVPGSLVFQILSNGAAGSVSYGNACNY